MSIYYNLVIALSLYFSIFTANAGAIEVGKKEYSKVKSSSNILIVVDFTKPQSEKRLYIINTKTNTIIDSMHVAQGHSPPFSNKPGSHQSSIGVYITADTYTGKHGLSRKLHGISKGYNDNAYEREIVIHKAPYVIKGGRSWGCFAVMPEKIDTLLKYSQPGTVLVAYLPSKLWN